MEPPNDINGQLIAFKILRLRFQVFRIVSRYPSIEREGFAGRIYLNTCHRRIDRCHGERDYRDRKDNHRGKQGGKTPMFVTTRKARSHSAPLLLGGLTVSG